MSASDGKRSHRWGRPACRVERGYGPVHIKLRRQLLREEPNCRMCAALGVEPKACIADHIVPKCQGGPTIRENYQSLCLAHSQSKSGREGYQMRLAKKRAREAVEARLNANG